MHITFHKASKYSIFGGKKTVELNKPEIYF